MRSDFEKLRVVHQPVVGVSYFFFYFSAKLGDTLRYLKNKSDFNKDSAELLINHSYFSSSVHCSYYSVFQFIKVKYVELAGIDSITLSQRIIADKRNSHKYLIDEFFLLLRVQFGARIDSGSLRTLKNEVKDLKQFRVDSDYEDIEINYDTGSKAFNKCKSILLELNRII